MRDTGYRDALLSYIDILGFRKLIERSATNQSIVPIILNVLRELKKQTSEGGRAIHESGKTKPVPIFRAFNFSDLTVRATFADTSTKYIDVLKWEFLYLSGFQVTLTCQQGILLRGAIVLGQISMEPDTAVNDDILLGPALVQAYELERQQPGPPRITIDSAVIEKVNQYPKFLWTEYIHKDDDGKFFVDYLFGAAADGLLVVGGKIANTLETLKAHKESVERGINNLTDRDHGIIEKLDWLISYHNGTIQRLKQRYEDLPDRFDIFDQQPIEIPDSLLIDTALFDSKK